MTTLRHATRPASPADTDMDPMLPEQLADRRRAPLLPEQRLMAAVLEDALNTRRRGPFATGRSPRLLYAEVRRWFASNDVRWPFSFVNVCHALGLEPSAVRTAAQALDADGSERRMATEDRVACRREQWALMTVPDRVAANQ